MVPETEQKLFKLLKNEIIDPIEPLTKLRNQLLVIVKTLQKQIKLQDYGNSALRNFNRTLSGRLSTGIMRDDVSGETPEGFHTPKAEEPEKKESALDSLFNEDQDYKMKLASQYDMLSYVGSDIDEVKMDHLSFFRLFHELQTYEDSIRMEQQLEFDPWVKSLLLPLDQTNFGLLGTPSHL